MNRKPVSWIARTAMMFAVLTLAANATAADFYVSSTAANRSDSNAGTSSTAPWATFAKVMSAWGGTIKAGDTVHLQKASVFTVAAVWNIDVGGSAAGGPITIRGDDYGIGAKPILRRTAVNADGWFNVRAGGYVTLRDFVMDGNSGTGLRAGGVIVGTSSQAAPITHVNIINMTMRNLASGAYYCSGIHLVPHNGKAISDCLIEGNDISGFTSWGLNHYQDKVGVRTQSLLNNITWRNNRIHDPSLNRWPNVNGGIHAMSGGSGNVFEYNYVEGAYQMGSFVLSNCVNDEYDLRVRYNVFKGNSLGYGIQIVEDTGGAQCAIEATFHGNVVIGCRLSGFVVGSDDYYSGVFNVFNNTFYNNHQDALYPSWGPVNNGGEIWAGSNNPRITLNLRNNLIVHTAVGGNSRVCLSLNNYDGTITHANNLYWHTGGAAATAIYNNGTVYTVSQALNYEPTGRNTDPLFTNAAQAPTNVTSAAGASPDGFLVAAGSPGIDRGVALASSFAGSIDNVPRPQGAGWDIGAYEVPGQAPAAPGNLTATALSSSSIRLNWQDNSNNETSFAIERGLDGATFSPLATTANNVVVYTNSGLAASIRYYYRIRASNTYGNSAYTATASATTPAPTDSTPPTLSSVRAAGHPAYVVAAFSEALQPTAAALAGNYALSGSIEVTGVTPHGSNAVILSVSPSLTDQTVYTLTVSNVKDLQGNAIASNTRTTFTYQRVDPALIVWYAFENNADDLSGRGNVGTVVGAVYTADGRHGRGVSFSALTHYVQTPLKGMTPQQGTIALWLRPNGFGAAPQYLFGHSSTAGFQDRIQLYTQNSVGDLNLGFGTQHALRTGILTLVDRQWQHLALTWNGTTYRLYVDGLERASGTFSGLGALNAFADVGNDGSTDYRTEGFSGEVDDVKIFNRALGLAEILVESEPAAVPMPPSAVQVVP